MHKYKKIDYCQDHMEAYICISHLHTQIFTFLCPKLCPYGTNCLRTFTTVSPLLLLNPLSIISIILLLLLFFRVNFALAYAPVYIYLI